MPETTAPPASDAPPVEPAHPLVTPEEAAKWLPESLQRPPIFHLLKATPAGQLQLQMIRSRAARGATDLEVAQFLEMCAQYMLDWNANEAWCAPSGEGDKRRVLLMTGRDGLRKIAHRNGLEFDGDIVRERDVFKVTRNADRTRTIEHSYAEAREQDTANRQGTTTAEERRRGPIVGAWCEVYSVDTGKQHGYFYAPMHEYRPTSEAKLKYSPWGSQESVMILAAAERTALSMAVSLSGVVAVGELDAGEERAAAGELTAGTGTGDEGTVELPEAVREVIARAREIGHAGLSVERTAAVAIGGQSPSVVSEWIARSHAELDAMEAMQHTEPAEEVDAEPVEDDAVEEPPEAVVAAESEALTPDEAERRDALRARANDLLSAAEQLRVAGNYEQAEEAEEEAERIMREVGADEDPNQGSLGL